MSLVISELTQLLGVNFASPKGYWYVQGLEPSEGLASTDFTDFFEPVHKTGHKKAFLDENGNLKKKEGSSILHGKEATLMGLYKGLILTPRVIGQGFFMYSSAVVQWHLHAARISRTYGCGATLNEILEGKDVPQEEKEKHKLRSLALAITAFTIYEGAGALGGYNAQQWNLWSRIWGEQTPLKMGEHFVDWAEALECAARFQSEEDQNIRKKMFKDWFFLGYPSIPKEVGDLIWVYYRLVEQYQKFEQGWGDAPDLENPNDRAAIWAGVFRRAAKGLLINKGVALKDVFAGDSPAIPLSRFILAKDEVFMADFQGNLGLTPFGEWMKYQITLAGERSLLVEAQAQMELDADNNPSEQGPQNRLSQKGKVRFFSLKNR
jgi:hypothetical protein